MKTFFILMFTSLILSGCLSQNIHQGNVIKPDNIWIIQEGDTRFSIEKEMGPPAIVDPAHPQIALYIEEVDDEDTQEKYTRGVEITYDKAWRATNIRRFGFE
ncbi:MAG: outer membrane protein assembly factor BamE [Ghiorsea sp.]